MASFSAFWHFADPRERIAIDSKPVLGNNKRQEGLERRPVAAKSHPKGFLAAKASPDMSQIEIIDQHASIAASCMVGADGLPGEALREILSECRYRVRFVAFDGRVEAGRIPIPSVRRLREVLRPHAGQVFGSVSVNPRFPEEGLEAMELGVRYLGMRAIGKMVPYMEDWETDEYRVMPIIQLAGNLDVPISIAVTYEEYVEGLIHLAESFPRTRFVMAHFLGRGWRFACRIAKQAKLSNLYLEVEMFPTPERAKLRLAAAIDAIGIDRIVFGSDVCLRPGVRYTHANQFLKMLQDLKLKDGAIERICSLNAREMLRLDP